MFDSQKLAKAEVEKLVSDTRRQLPAPQQPLDQHPAHSQGRAQPIVSSQLHAVTLHSTIQDSKLKFFFLRTLGVVVSCVPVQLEREFEELDVDHDGFITAEDLVAASRSAPSNSNNAGE
jgi:hypothetical protein